MFLSGPRVTLKRSIFTCLSIIDRIKSLLELEKKSRKEDAKVCKNKKMRVTDNFSALKIRVSSNQYIFN